MRKKIKIKKAIYGKKQFNLPEELDYYKKYKMINIPDDLVDEVIVAAGYGVEQMRAHFTEIETPYPIRIVILHSPSHHLEHSPSDRNDFYHCRLL